MLDEIVTETTRPDAPGADKSLFGDAEDETPPSAEEQDADKEAAQEPQGSDNAGDGADTETQTDASEELKVVVSIKRGRAVIGVQQPSSDPYIETFEDHDLPALA